jgi:hypothetical protein
VTSDTVLARVAAYPAGGVLSRLCDDGYPASVRVGARWLEGTSEVVLDPLPSYAAGWHGAATLLFHRHDERLEGLAQLVLKGAVEERPDGAIVFMVVDLVTANGRADTDEMPHAGAPLHMLQFFRLGRRKANEYLRRRGAPWPPIPYDAIARAVGEVDRA